MTRLAAFALALTTASALVQAAGGAVEAVRTFNVPPFEAKNQSERFTGASCAASKRTAAAEETDGEAGCIALSIAPGAQDTDEAAIANTLHLTARPLDDQAERVTAEFTLFDEPSTVVWEMREVDGA